ncbi:unnamed protein product [Tilletia controversa]|uniref:Uncharacterized protein n=1 Tax=Tilletia controversa TaxID=13291 RepID=A0A8X7MTQ4_9BASI|nr:hypothetical protein A4X06_0g3892 [Tilletia controversa]CAD6931010.1 unnamed protein product [Tilletia controversa]CAD6952451.1 unnamed protein product [Tilletia controversa]CAD6974729.1 unnamed protein product [Tilletia controversa]CAD6980439.1 unnamed protein product [Tilletia controversa]
MKHLSPSLKAHYTAALPLVSSPALASGRRVFSCWLLLVDQSHHWVEGTMSPVFGREVGGAARSTFRHPEARRAPWEIWTDYWIMGQGWIRISLFRASCAPGSITRNMGQMLDPQTAADVVTHSSFPYL